MLKLLESSFLFNGIGILFLLVPSLMYAFVAFKGGSDRRVPPASRWLAKEFGRYFVHELPNILSITTFISFILVFTKITAAFVATTFLLLLYICIKGIEYRNGLREKELPDFFQESDRMFFGFWRQLTFATCLIVFYLLIYIGAEISKHLHA